MSELKDYKDKIYDLVHPELRLASEEDKFGNSTLVKEGIRELGFMRFISDMFSEIMYKQKKNIEKFKYLYDYSSINYNSGKALLLNMLDSEIFYDDEVKQYYVYYNNISPLDYSNLFDESWVLYDDTSIFGVDRVVVDVDLTNEKKDHSYYYRIYLGGKSPQLRPYYVLLKPSFLYHLGKNKGLNIHLLNSYNVNVSLMSNAYRLIANKGSLDNLKNLAQSLEAEIDIVSFTSITIYYKDLLQEYLSVDDFKKLVYEYEYEGKVTYLLKGILYALRFEDFRIDYLSEVNSFVVSDSNNSMILQYEINKEFVVMEFDNDDCYNVSMYSELDVSNGTVEEVNLQIGVDESEDCPNLFLRRIGETDNWYLRVSVVYNGNVTECVYQLKSIDFSFYENEHFISYYFIPTFHHLIHDEIVTQFRHTNRLQGEIYYDYMKYYPISIPTKFIEINMNHEVNSSISKSVFNLAEYNKNIIKDFYPDYYTVFRYIEEYNGERSFF